MPLTRSDVVSALNFFLTGKVTQDRIYEWGLSQVVAKDYDEIVNADPLLKETMQAIMDMNNSGQGHTPTRADLIYYLRCLEGAVSFEPLSVRLGKVRAKEREQDKFSFTREHSLVWARIYVVLFAACSFLINTISIFKPELFNVNADQFFWENFFDALPQLVYSGVLFLPLRMIVRGWAFYIYFLIFVVGMLAYWVATVSIVMNLELHLYLILVFAPFGGLPPAIAVWLLWQKRKEFLKARNN